MQSVTTLLQELELKHFYGSLEIRFEAGRIVLMKKIETIKPLPENYRDNRGIKNGTENHQERRFK